MPTVLVTGATGFIGGAVAKRLLQDDLRVVCPVRRAAEVPGAVVVPVFTVEALDAALPGEEIDTIFHLASYGVHPGERDPGALAESNTRLLITMLQFAAKRGVRRFVHAGTCAEYRPVNEPELLTEGHRLGPPTLYGAAKAAAFLLGRAVARDLAVPFVALRAFGVYGPGERAARMIPYIAERLSRGETVDLTPGGQARDLLYVGDLADAFARAGTAEGLEPYSAYNVCTGVPVTVREVAETIASIAGAPSDLLAFGSRPYRADEPMWLIGDHARFSAATGWIPKVGLDEGIRRALTAVLGPRS